MDVQHSVHGKANQDIASDAKDASQHLCNAR